MSDTDYPEILSDLSTKVCNTLVNTGMAKPQAHAAASAVTEHISEHWGGQLIYIPKASRFKLSAKYQEIFGKFNGHNHRDLALEYGVCVQRIYQIIKEEQQRQKLNKSKAIYKPRASGK